MKNPIPNPLESCAEKPLEDEPWRPYQPSELSLDFTELKIEKNLKDKMKSMDPANLDFSEEFFNHLHDKVMAQVEQKQIQPPETWTWSRFARRAQIKLLGKTF